MVFAPGRVSLSHAAPNQCGVEVSGSRGHLDWNLHVDRLWKPPAATKARDFITEEEVAQIIAPTPTDLGVCVGDLFD